MKGDQAQTLRAWANHEIANGDGKLGREMLTEAHALFKTLGVDTQQEARARL
jgi:hypothetical protein